MLDKPGPPRNLNISDVRSDSCYITWMEPEDDGGSVITNYVVERKDVVSAQWVAISSSSKKRSHMAKYLMEGTQYLFRVAAENQYGRGPYVETLKPIKAIDPLRKCFSVIRFVLFIRYLVILRLSCWYEHDTLVP